MSKVILLPCIQEVDRSRKSQKSNRRFLPHLDEKHTAEVLFPEWTDLTCKSLILFLLSSEQIKILFLCELLQKLFRIFLLLCIFLKQSLLISASYWDGFPIFEGICFYRVTKIWTFLLKKMEFLLLLQILTLLISLIFFFQNPYDQTSFFLKNQRK